MSPTPTDDSLPDQPSPPNPSEDAGLIPRITSPLDKNAIPSPPTAVSWDANTLRPETAMKMLCRAVQALANVSGDIPPTPPLTRFGTPGRLTPSTNGVEFGSEAFRRHHRRTSSRPATPVPNHDIKAPSFIQVDVGAPEACMNEPATADVGANALDSQVQQEAIARKFFSKAPPRVSLEEYMARLQRYCPMSTAVYLAAGVYIHKLSVEEKLVPVTSRTIHRLVLASLRVAMKALEDLRYPQHRFAGVGGVSESELRLLEIALCYLTNFDLQVDNELLYKKTIGLQQAAFQSTLVKSRLQPGEMKLRLPINLAQRAKVDVSV
ncbi:cyclin-domain-containing protein [Tothia fuscella]|uniref:Cyclin-domain-containing protein n=1 Tax=Tothia fuscella TaxID=1048955 RepID=A0A9P4NJL2_9PEZI|nr:cyclin-domain-containing protein [Tothia fuscella]